MAAEGRRRWTAGKARAAGAHPAAAAATAAASSAPAAAEIEVVKTSETV